MTYNDHHHLKNIQHTCAWYQPARFAVWDCGSSWKEKQLIQWCKSGYPIFLGNTWNLFLSRIFKNVLHASSPLEKTMSSKTLILSWLFSADSIEFSSLLMKNLHSFKASITGSQFKRPPVSSVWPFPRNFCADCWVLAILKIFFCSCCNQILRKEIKEKDRCLKSLVLVFFFF